MQIPESVHSFRKLLIKTVLLISEQGAGKSLFKKPKSCISGLFHRSRAVLIYCLCVVN